MRACVRVCVCVRVCLFVCFDLYCPASCRPSVQFRGNANKVDPLVKAPLPGFMSFQLLMDRFILGVTASASVTANDDE